jgi:hypothetical protein
MAMVLGMAATPCLAQIESPPANSRFTDPSPMQSRANEEGAQRILRARKIIESAPGNGSTAAKPALQGANGAQSRDGSKAKNAKGSSQPQ